MMFHVRAQMFKEHDKIKSELQKRTADHTKCRARYEDAVKQAETAVINRDAGVYERLAICPGSVQLWIATAVMGISNAHVIDAQAARRALLPRTSKAYVVQHLPGPFSFCF